MKKTIAVLGCGLVGELIAKELSRDYIVNVYDNNIQALTKMDDTPSCYTYEVDLSDTNEIARIAKVSDVVVSAVPGFLGHSVLKVCATMKRPVADISFSPEDPYTVFADAVRGGVPLVVDCGVAPGMSNLFVGMAVADMDTADEITIMVGGLPLKRTWPFDYNLVFSLTDVIEEYTRPCRYRENGHDIVRPALTDREFVDLPRVGTLEAFNTDGLRTLLRTMSAPTMKEKTLRFPGHIEKMMVFREAGFFDNVDIEVDGREMNPRKLTEKLFTKSWNLPKGDDEFTVLRVDVLGKVKGLARRVVWDLYDQTNPITRQTSMARTTGLPAVSIARMLAEHELTTLGVQPLEELGRHGSFGTRMVQEMRAHGISITRTEY